MDHTPKMDVLPKSFIQIILAAKCIVRHSGTPPLFFSFFNELSRAYSSRGLGGRVLAEGAAGGREGEAGGQHRLPPRQRSGVHPGTGNHRN